MHRDRPGRAFSNSSLMGLTKVLDTYSAASLPSSIARAVLGTWQGNNRPPSRTGQKPWSLGHMRRAGRCMRTVQDAPLQMWLVSGGAVNRNLSI